MSLKVSIMLVPVCLSWITTYYKCLLRCSHREKKADFNKEIHTNLVKKKNEKILNLAWTLKYPCQLLLRMRDNFENKLRHSRFVQYFIYVFCDDEHQN